MARKQAGAIISTKFIKVLRAGGKRMKKFMILASMVAIVVAALALPALAQNRAFGEDGSRYDERQAQRFANFLEDFYADNHRWEDDNDRWEDDNDGWWDHNDWWNDRGDDRDDRNDRNDDFDNNDAAPVITQEFDQEAQSGDVSQSFNVSNTGDNSNQCAGIQGVANTGNAQNQIGVLQYGSEADEFSFEDSGASIDVSPTNLTSCDQQINQTATAAYYGR
jgi:Tfp pilus assembly protein PilV